MRCPKCYTETPPDALNCPGCNLTTPKGKAVVAADKEKKAVAAAKEKRKLAKNSYGLKTRRQAGKEVNSRDGISVNLKALIPAGGRWVYYLVVFLLLGGGGFGAYWYIHSSPQPVDAKVAMNVMDQLRKLPSKEEGKTIDEAMKAELTKAKDAGELVNFQGWTVKPYDHSSYLVSFTYEEKSGKKSAEWIANPKTSTFIAHSELAMAVHK